MAQGVGRAAAQRLFWPAWAGDGARSSWPCCSAPAGSAPLLAFGLGGFAGGRRRCARSCWPPAGRAGAALVGRTNGGMIVHLGVVMIAVALAASSSYDTERELTMDVGDSATVAGHEITYLGPRTVEQSNKTSIRAQVSVDGRGVRAGHQRFAEGEPAVGTPSVATSPARDVYLALLRCPTTTPASRIVLRVIVQPLVMWLWIGGAVMVLGTVLAAFPGRRRSPDRPVSAAATRGRDRARRCPASRQRRRPRWRARPASEPVEVPDVRSTTCRARVGESRATTGDDVADGAGPPANGPDRLGGGGGAGVGFVAVLATREPATDRRRDAARSSARWCPRWRARLSTAAPSTSTTSTDRWVVVNFFATWCVPCRIEHPELDAFDEAHRRTGDAVLVSVLFDDDPAERPRVLRAQRRRLAGGARQRRMIASRLRRAQGARDATW